MLNSNHLQCMQICMCVASAAFGIWHRNHGTRVVCIKLSSVSATRATASCCAVFALRNDEWVRDTLVYSIFFLRAKCSEEGTTFQIHPEVRGQLANRLLECHLGDTGYLCHWHFSERDRRAGERAQAREGDVKIHSWCISVAKNVGVGLGFPQ